MQALSTKILSKVGAQKRGRAHEQRAAQGYIYGYHADLNIAWRSKDTKGKQRCEELSLPLELEKSYHPLLPVIAYWPDGDQYAIPELKNRDLEVVLGEKTRSTIHWELLRFVRKVPKTTDQFRRRCYMYVND